MGLYLLFPLIAITEFICALTMPAFARPNIAIILLGIANIASGLGLQRWAARYMAHDLQDPHRDDFYLTPRPVQDKLGRLQPGYHGYLLALIYTLVGLFMLGTQAFMYFKGDN